MPYPLLEMYKKRVEMSHFGMNESIINKLAILQWFVQRMTIIIINIVGHVIGQSICYNHFFTSAWTVAGSLIAAILVVAGVVRTVLLIIIFMLWKR